MILEIYSKPRKILQIWIENTIFRSTYLANTSVGICQSPPSIANIKKIFLRVHHAKETAEITETGSFNAQIDFTMHEMERFMIHSEKLMTAEKASKKKAKANEIEFINIDTDGRDFHSSVASFFSVLPSYISLDGLLGSRWDVSLFFLVLSAALRKISTLIESIFAKL